MLYCPKCQQTYEDAVQRFCLKDGSRLLPAPSSGKSANQTSGVFTNVLKRKPKVENDKFSSAPGFSKAERSRFLQSNFQPPVIVSEIFKSEPSLPIVESPVIESLPKIIIQSEIPTGTAQLDAKKTNGKERDGLTWNNPQILIGQIIKGRYHVVELIGEDEDNFTYLAEDKIILDKKVVVRILLDEQAGDTFSNKIFDEERVALTHVNHPNIANVIDSGTLPEGYPFVLTEFVKGKSVKDNLRTSTRLDAVRTARIIRQVSYALDEAHQNGVLHRNLKPESIILPPNENGTEEVKLTDFGTPRGGLNEENLPYKSPEQLAGKLANFASDEFSLAVIAYQMLTNRLPFGETSVGSLLKAQREGLKIQPTIARTDLPPSVDTILQKALSFNAFDRYPRVRGFGDALFNAVTNNGLLESKETEEIENINEIPIPEPTTPLISKIEKNAPSKNDIQNFSQVSDVVNLDVNREKLSDDSALEITSPESKSESTAKNTLFAILGVAILLLGLWGIWSLFLNRPNGTELNVQNAAQTSDTSDAKNQSLADTNTASPQEVEAPPLARTIMPPPDTIYFQNSKENSKADAMRNFLGFSLYYPKDWKIKAVAEEGSDLKARSNFLDISKNAPSGTPIEQMTVSYYNSNGTFNNDTEIFAEQVRETNETLKKILPNYEMISEGEKTINNGWRGYEVKFQGTGKTTSGENITLWGKRLFIPTAIRAMKNGYVITTLATSLSNEVKSADDVGVKGELPGILATFEPNQNF